MGEAENIPAEAGRTPGGGVEQAKPSATSEPAVPRRMDRRRLRKKHRVARTFSIVGTAILAVVVVIAVLLLILGGFARGGRAFAGGYRPLIVLSGSMVPKMPVGSVVISKSVDPTVIKVGDIITFTQRSALRGSNEPFVSHRVVHVLNQATGLSFVTKGDANNTTDSAPVLASQVVGRVILILPFVGKLSQFVHRRWGWILMVILPAFILISWEVVDVVVLSGKKK
jgi:signal peptidase I